MSDRSLLITNGFVVTMDEARTIVEDGAVYVEDGEIREVGPAGEISARHPGTTVLDARGQWVMPGSICAHTHFYGVFARGMGLRRAPADFPEILRELWWPLDRALEPEGIRLSALVCLIDAIRHGTTTLIDHHASQRCIDGSLDLIAGAVQEAGLRACLCFEVTDRGGPEVAEAGIRENVRWLKRVRSEQPARLAGLFGLHASLSLGDETLERCRGEAEDLGGVGFHLHAAEGPADQEDCLRRFGQRVIERLAQHGILGPDTIIAHAIDIDPWEMALLRDTRTWVSHQPRSNMNNGVGTADVPVMTRGGVRVALGNDGFSNDMFEEMKAAYLIHKAWRRDPRAMPADQLMKIAYDANASLATQVFGQPIGRLAPGYRADIILVDYHPPTPVTPGNLPWHIVFGVEGGQVTTTICDGQVLMDQGVIRVLDEEGIMRAAREEARRTWDRYAELMA